MKLFRLFLACCLMLPVAVIHAAPQVGEPAPDFELKGSDGKQYSLSDFKGEKWTVIAFFPKAFTTG